MKKKDEIKVKMLCNWTNSKQLCEEWNKMTQGDYTWNNIKLTWENDNDNINDNIDNIDYWVIINKPPPNEYYNPAKTIIFQMEPWVNDPTKNWGVKTWGEWANSLYPCLGEYGFILL